MLTQLDTNLQVVLQFDLSGGQSGISLDNKVSAIATNAWLLVSTGASFTKHGLTIIPAWISNYIHYKVWDEIAYPFLNFKGCTDEV